MNKIAKSPRVEWVTIWVLMGCYLVWGLSTTFLAAVAPTFAILITALTIALHSSLQHEIIHGHPTRQRWLNEAMVFPALTVIVPFYRFRDTHIDHHIDSRITDPFDDPESNYLDQGDWDKLPPVSRAVLAFNNTLMGRLFIGVLISQLFFVRNDLRAIGQGDRQVITGWLLHIPAVALVIGWIWWADMALWHYLIAADARTVVIEDRGLLAFLFLNNNLHAAHHDRPGIPWYDLPSHFRDHRADYLKRNDGYGFASYRELFARHFLSAKDPVAHPIWRRG